MDIESGAGTFFLIPGPTTGSDSSEESIVETSPFFIVITDT